MLTWVFLSSAGGDCLDLGQSVLCRCQPGFTGANCQVNIDDCASSPCENAGTCQDGVNDYTCSCTLGYTGKNCSVRSDACGARPCQNGGTCFTHFTGPVCQCPKGFMGPSCEFTLQPSFKPALRQSTQPSSATLTVSCILSILVLVLVAGIIFLRRRRRLQGRKQLSDSAVYNDFETVNNLGGSERDSFLVPNGLFKISNSTARLSLSLCPDGRSGFRPVESSLVRGERQDFMWRDEAGLGSVPGLRWNRKKNTDMEQNEISTCCSSLFMHSEDGGKNHELNLLCSCWRKKQKTKMWNKILQMNFSDEDFKQRLF